MKMLIAHALEDEKGNIHFPGHQVSFCCTGMGKVQAGLAVEEAVLTRKPDLVLNIGSCGALHFAIGDILMCTRFIDRDLLKVAIPGICSELMFTDDIRKAGLFPGQDIHYTVSTGDSFVTAEAEMGPFADVIDMEAFAIACACQRHGIPFVAIKYVTDIIGKNSVKAWTEKLASSRSGLEAFLQSIQIET